MSLNFFVRNTAYSSPCCDIKCHCNKVCSLKSPLSSSLQRRTPSRPYSLVKLTHERACRDVMVFACAEPPVITLCCEYRKITCIMLVLQFIAALIFVYLNQFVEGKCIYMKFYICLNMVVFFCFCFFYMHPNFVL